MANVESQIITALEQMKKECKGAFDHAKATTEYMKSSAENVLDQRRCIKELETKSFRQDEEMLSLAHRINNLLSLMTGIQVSLLEAIQNKKSTTTPPGVQQM